MLLNLSFWLCWWGEVTVNWVAAFKEPDRLGSIAFLPLILHVIQDVELQYSHCTGHREPLLMKGMDAGLTGTLAVPMLPKVAIIQRATLYLPISFFQLTGPPSHFSD